jgi:hypothetical protein
MRPAFTLAHRSARAAFLLGILTAQLQAQALQPKTAHCSFSAREAMAAAASNAWLFQCASIQGVAAQLVQAGSDIGCWFKGQPLATASQSGMAKLFYKVPAVTGLMGGWALENITFSLQPTSMALPINLVGALVHRHITLVQGDTSQTWFLKTVTLKRAPGNCSNALQQAFQ